MNQLATTQPIVLPDFKPVFADEEVRQYPEAKFPFLRFQIGRKIDRPMLEPRFEGQSLVCHFRNGRKVSSFRLLGWGETLDAAQRMASKKSKSSPILSASSQNEKVLDMGSKP